MDIASQFCEESNDPDWVGNEVVQLRMKIAVVNRGNAPVLLRPDQLRLLAPDGVAAEPVSSDGPIVLATNESRIVAVRFMNRGSLTCRGEMKLDAAAAVRAGAKPVPLQPIAFTARGAT
jgi:hypothetical protein